MAKPKVNAKKVAGSTSMLKKKKSEEKKTIQERVVDMNIDLEKLFLPIGIVLAALLIACGLFFGLGGSSASDDYICYAYEPLSLDCLKSYANEVDLDMGEFESCVADQTHYDLLRTNIEELNQIGIQSPPQIILGEVDNGIFEGFYIGGTQEYDYYSKLIQEIEANGLENAHDNFISENLGTIDALTDEYKQNYKQQLGSTSELTDEEIQSIAQTTAKARFADYDIREYTLTDEIVLGEKYSQVVMMFYSDFDCAYCKTFANEVMPRLEEDYVNNNELTIIHRELPLEESEGLSFRASNAAMCAGDQDRFWQYYNEVFSTE